MVLLGLILVSVLHFLTRTGDPALHAWHIFFRKLYFLPIVAGALWFGLRGALTTAVTAIGFYALHLLFDWPRFHLERMNQVGEMASFLVFAAVAGALVELEHRTKARAEAMRRNAERKKIATVVASLSETLGARDPATRDHSRRVAELASGLGRFMGMSNREVQDVYLAGILHDIGKIGIRDDVLLKPSALTPEDRTKIMEHPRIAEKILAPVGFSTVIRYVGVHHENWDGSGYPEGLCGEAIPLPGRILAVADTYDALNSNRPYHQGLAQNGRIREVMAGMAGTKLDGEVLKRFWEYMNETCPFEKS
jgi:HD-GYP domain-containing protein (c-di-GMP phosphodiesterase class II)